MSAVPFRLTRWPALTQPQGERQEHESFERFAEQLRVPQVHSDKAKLPGWSPALFQHDRRNKAGCEAVTALVLDYDEQVPQLPVLRALWGEWLGLVHSTWSHRPEAPRFRVILPLARPVGARQFEALVRWAYEQAARLGHTVDTATRDPSRLWFWPAVPASAREQYIWQPLEGELLDPAALPLEAEAPLWEQALGIAAASSGRSARPAPVVTAPSDSERGRRYALRTLAAASNAVRSAPEGERNVTLNKEAYSVAGLVASGLLDRESSREALREAAQSAGLAAQEIERTLSSAFGAGQRAPRAVPAPAVRTSGARAARNGPEAQPQIPPAPAAVRPLIEISTDEHITADLTLAALGRCPNLFQRAGQLVQLVLGRSDAGIERPSETPTIAPVDRAHLRELACRYAAYVVPQTNPSTGEVVHRPARPDGHAIAALHARGYWPELRWLDGLAETPVLRPDGSVCETPGYDERTGIYFAPSLRFPKVPEAPTQRDARAALERLKAPLSDFPFASEAHRAAALAAILTPLARTGGYSGSTPLFLIDANVRGAGKTLLADVLSTLVAGRPMARTSFTPDDDEMRKRITAVVMAGDTLVLLDNVRDELGGPSIEAALTGSSWGDRVLGQNRMVKLPQRATWFATGNNLTLSSDLSRRTVHIRLRSPHERPEERRSFRYPDVVAWVHEHRAELVVDALTILRAWLLAGRPDMDLVPWGGFETWSRLVRNALFWAGAQDPGSTRSELRARSDTTAGALGQLLDGWQEVAAPFGGRCTVAQALAAIARNDLESSGPHPTEPRRYESLRAALAELCPTPLGKPPTVRQVGAVLRSFHERVVGDRALVMAGKDRKDNGVWAVRALDLPT